MKQLFFVLLIINYSLNMQAHIKGDSLPISNQKDNTSYKLETLDEKLEVCLSVSLKDNNLKVEYAQEFTDFVTHLKKRFHSKNLSKRILNKIFRIVRNEYLDTFYCDAQLQDVFVEGKFNCAVGSAIFAMVFDEMNIPYKIQERPSHTYLVVFIGDEIFKIESTKRQGVTRINHRSENHYSGILKTVDFKSLVANLFYNACITARKNGNFIEGNRLFNIAYRMYPNRKYYKVSYDDESLNALINGLKTSKQDAKEDIFFVLKYASEEFMINTRQNRKYTHLFAFFNDAIDKDEFPHVHSELQKENFVNFAIAAAENSQLNDALIYIQKAYEIQPGDYNVQFIIHLLAKEKISQTEMFKRLQIQRDLQNRFPCLKED